MKKIIKNVRLYGKNTDITVENGRLTAITVEGPNGTYSLPCRQVVLCPGWNDGAELQRSMEEDA